MNNVKHAIDEINQRYFPDGQMKWYQSFMDKYGIYSGAIFVVVLIILASVDTDFSQTFATGIAVVIAATGIYLVARGHEGNFKLVESQKRSLIAMAAQLRILHDKLVRLSPENNQDKVEHVLSIEETKVYFKPQYESLVNYGKEDLACLYALKVSGRDKLYENYLTMVQVFTSIYALGNNTESNRKALRANVQELLNDLSSLDAKSLRNAYSVLSTTNNFLAFLSFDTPETMGVEKTATSVESQTIKPTSKQSEPTIKLKSSEAMSNTIQTSLGPVLNVKDESIVGLVEKLSKTLNDPVFNKIKCSNISNKQLVDSYLCSGVASE